MPLVLFVCTANRFRSPIAAACFRKELASRKLEAGWQVLSAGTWTSDGLPALPDAILDARSLGLDIQSHRSRVIDAQLAGEADLILVMEQGQKEALRSEYPESAGKVYLISEIAAAIPYDIPDPAQSSHPDGIHTEIDQLVRSGFDRICSMATHG